MSPKMKLYSDISNHSESDSNNIVLIFIILFIVIVLGVYAPLELV